MKSFKNKILQKGKAIKAQIPSSKDISNIIDKIDTGDIFMPKGYDKINFANQNHSKLNKLFYTPKSIF